MGWAQKKSVRILGVLLAVVLLAVVAIKVFLPAEKIRDLALDQARAKLGREVSVGEVAVSLRGGLGVRLADFAIHNPDGFGGEHLLSARSLDLKLALKPLFKGEFRVHRLVLDGPVLNLVRRKGGADNFTFAANTATGAGQKAATAGPAGTAPPLSIASLTVRDGAVSFVDTPAAPAAGQNWRLSGLTLTSSLADPAPGRYQAVGQVTAEQIVVVEPAYEPVLKAELDFDLVWDAQASRLEFQQVAGTLADLALTCTGNLVMGGEAVAGEMKIQGQDLALVDLTALAPPELAAKISGGPNSGRVDAEILLGLTGQPDAFVRTETKFTVRDADLALAQPFLPPQQPGLLAGRGDLELSYTIPADTTQPASYGGTLVARGVSFTQSGLVDDLQQLDARFRFTPEDVTIENCRARFGSGTFDLTGVLRDPFPYFLPPEMQGDGPLPTPHLSFTLRSPRLDVDRLIPAASPSAPAGTAGAAARNPAATRTELEFPGLSSDGTFAADTLIYMQVPFTQVTGKVKLRDRVMTCSEVTGAVYDGRVDGQVAVDLKDLNAPGFTGSYSAKAIEINNFMSRFAGLAGVVFGGCDMSGSFAARGRSGETIRNSLTLDSDAGVKQGRVVTRGSAHTALGKLATQTGKDLGYEQALRDLATHITVADGRVGVNELTTRLGDLGDLTVDGSYGFNGDLDYSGRLRLTKAQTDLLFSGGVLAELGKLLGQQRPERLELPLTVGGTRSDPKFKLDLGAVTSELQKKAVNEQGRRLEDEAKDKLNDLLNKWK
jgi:uncharacterized protein involved in outer membrane biogenesis